MVSEGRQGVFPLCENCVYYPMTFLLTRYIRPVAHFAAKCVTY